MFELLSKIGFIALVLLAFYIAFIILGYILAFTISAAIIVAGVYAFNKVFWEDESKD